MKLSTETMSRKRRRLLQFPAGLPFLPGIWNPMLRPARAAVSSSALARVRPGEPGWPSEAQWNELGQQVGELVKVQSPLATCVNAPDSADCQQLFKGLKNPYFLGDVYADWQRAFWGSNYSRLLAVKDQYDPDGLFFVHHGAGSERWSADGFTKLV
jgi:hypothetical protein